MDNLSVRKVDGVRQRVKAVGTRLLYPSPDSPDLNPIEKARSKLKTLLRSQKHRRQKRFKTQSNAAYQTSPLRMHKLGSDSPSQYSYQEPALQTRIHPCRKCLICNAALAAEGNSSAAAPDVRFEEP